MDRTSRLERSLMRIFVDLAVETKMNINAPCDVLISERMGVGPKYLLSNVPSSKQTTSMHFS